MEHAQSDPRVSWLLACLLRSLLAAGVKPAPLHHGSSIVTEDQFQIRELRPPYTKLRGKHADPQRTGSDAEVGPSDHQTVERIHQGALQHQLTWWSCYLAVRGSTSGPGGPVLVQIVQF